MAGSKKKKKGAAPPPVRRKKEPKTAAIAFIVAAIGFAVLAGLAPKGFWVIDSGLKYLMVRSISSDQTDGAELIYTNAAHDPDFRFNPFPPPWSVRVGDKIYPPFPPAFAYLSIPFYRAFGTNGLLIIPLLAGLIAAVLFAMIAGEDRNIRAAAMLAAAFGSPLLFYSLTFWEHTLTAALALGAAYLIFLKRSRASVIAAGALIAASVWLREESIIWLGAFSIGLFLDRGLSKKAAAKSVALLFLGALPVLVGLLFFQYHALGAALGRHVSANIGIDGADGLGYLSGRLQAVAEMIFNVSENRSVSIAFWLAAIAWGAIEILDARRVAKNISSGLICLFIGALLIQRIDGEPSALLLHADGLAITFPLVLTALAYRRDGEAVKLAPAAASALIFIAAAVMLIPSIISSGMHFSPRVLLPAALILAAIGFRALSGKRSRSLLIALAVLSLGLQLLSIHWLFIKKGENERLAAVLAQSPATDIIVGSFWFAGDQPDAYLNKRIWRVTGTEKMAEFQGVYKGLNEQKSALVVLPIKNPNLGAPIFEPNGIFGGPADWVYKLDF